MLVCCWFSSLYTVVKIMVSQWSLTVETAFVMAEKLRETVTMATNT